MTGTAVSGVAAAAGHGEGADAVGSHALVVLAAVLPGGPAGRPGVGTVLAAGAVSLVLALPLRWLATHALTAVHEGGHLTFALWGGAFIHHVHVDRDGGGSTLYSRIPALDDFVASAMGYLGPPTAGLLLADLVARGRPDAVLGLTLGFLLFVLLFLRKIFGPLYVLLLAGLFLALIVRAGPDLRAFSATVWAWFLLTGGLIDIVTVWTRATDYDFMLPGLVGRRGWAVINTLLSGTATGYAALVLLGVNEPFL